MTSISQCEDSYRLTNEQFQDSSKSNQERPVTSFTQFEEKSTVSSSPGQKASTPTSFLQPQGLTLTTIATELRIQIYKFLFKTPATHLLRRRAGINDERVIEKLTHTFDCNILFTCRKLYEEGLAVFYANQTFHYSSSIGGYFSGNRHLMVNLSIDLESPKCSGDTDAVLSALVTEFAQHCPKLRTLTIHLVADFCSSLAFREFSTDNATGNVLRKLHPRLDSLSIIALGSGPHVVVPRLRRSVADDEYWSNRCVSHQLDPGWPGGRTRNSQWPYLTIPSLIQKFVHRACSKSSIFRRPPLEDDYIYEWTCQKEVKEEVRLDSLAIAN